MSDTTGLQFHSVTEFFTKVIAPVYRRKITFPANTITWCPWWWKHPEAVMRIDALWTAWEQLRSDPAMGMSTWFLNHADPNMAALLSTEGTFKSCTDQVHKPQTPLRMADPGEAHINAPAMRPVQQEIEFDEEAELAGLRLVVEDQANTITELQRELHDRDAEPPPPQSIV